jgi:Arc/MetJ-type ribon-helix-helix transcriptional regulator
MPSPVTLRLDEETRRRIALIARRRRVSASQVIRDAIQAAVSREEETASPYDAVADLIGMVHGGNPTLSSDMGRQFSELLKRRRARR